MYKFLAIQLKVPLDLNTLSRWGYKRLCYLLNTLPNKSHSACTEIYHEIHGVEKTLMMRKFFSLNSKFRLRLHGSTATDRWRYWPHQIADHLWLSRKCWQTKKAGYRRSEGEMKINKKMRWHRQCLYDLIREMSATPVPSNVSNSSLLSNWLDGTARLSGGEVWQGCLGVGS